MPCCCSDAGQVWRDEDEALVYPALCVCICHVPEEE